MKKRKDFYWTDYDKKHYVQKTIFELLPENKGGVEENAKHRRNKPTEITE